MTKPDVGKIVDVDSHFFEPFDWIRNADRGLFEEMNASLPKFSMADFLFSEILSTMPEEKREAVRRALPMDFLGAGKDEPLDMDEAAEMLDNFAPVKGLLEQPGPRGGGDRVRFCDEHGIDLQLIYPTLAVFDYLRIKRHNRGLLTRFCQTYNGWALAAVDGHTDRLSPGALLDLTDPAQAARELTGLREQGMRTWLVPLDPWDGRPLSHPSNDPLWAASVDLGVTPVFHIGMGSVRIDDGWINTGRPNPELAIFRVFAALASLIAEIGVSDLIFNGVFEQHPDLVILCAEFGVTWYTALSEKLWPPENRINIQSFVPWEAPLLPHEYLKRNVRVSPLPGDPVARFIHEMGEAQVLFASDYPHPEGSAVAVEEFTAELEDKVDAGAQARFFGENAQALLALH